MFPGGRCMWQFDLASVREQLTWCADDAIVVVIAGSGSRSLYRSDGCQLECIARQRDGERLACSQCKASTGIWRVGPAQDRSKKA